MRSKDESVFLPVHTLYSFLFGSSAYKVKLFYFCLLHRSIFVFTPRTLNYHGLANNNEDVKVLHSSSSWQSFDFSQLSCSCRQLLECTR